METPSEELEFNLLVLEEMVNKVVAMRKKMAYATNNLADKVNALDKELEELEGDIEKFSDISLQDEPKAEAETNEVLSAIRHDNGSVGQPFA